MRNVLIIFIICSFYTWGQCALTRAVAQQDNRILLLHAIIDGASLDAVRALIQQIEFIDQPYSVEKLAGATPLMLAVSCARADLGPGLLEILISEKGADLGARDIHGCTALHYAFMYCHSECLYRTRELVAILLNHGASLEAVNNRGQTALHMAVSKIDDDLIDLMLNHENVQAYIERIINIQDENGRTPLHYAAYAYKRAVQERLPFLVHKNEVDMRSLRNKGALDTLPDRDGMTVSMILSYISF